MNSFYKTYIFFLGFLIFSIYFILEPPEGKARIQSNTQEVPILEVDHFKFYTLFRNQPDMLVVGTKAKQFKDREEFWEFFLTNFDVKSSINQEMGKIEYFDVKYGIRRGKKYEFYDGFTYSNDEGIKFKSKEGIYLSEQKIFQGNGEFEFENSQGIFNGNNLFYNGQTEELKADLPRGKIWLGQ